MENVDDIKRTFSTDRRDRQKSITEIIKNEKKSLYHSLKIESHRSLF